MKALFLKLSFRQRLIVAILLIEVFVISAEVYLRQVYYQPMLRVFPTGQQPMDRDRMEDFALTGKAYFTANRMGLRGPEINSSYDKKILVIGNSASVGIFLDDKEIWPHHLAEELKTQGMNVWTGVGSLTGNRYPENHYQLEHFLNEIEDLDLVIVMGGGIDLILKLAGGEAYQPNVYRTMTERLFAKEASFSWKVEPFHIGNPALLQFLTNPMPPPAKEEMTIPNDYFVKVRNYRVNGETLEADALPDFSEEFKAIDFHVKGMAKLAKERKVPLLFLTQPHSWRENLTPEMEKNHWMGFAGDEYDFFPWGKKYKKYYSAKALEFAAKIFREKEIESIRNTGNPVLNTYEIIEPKPDFFLDDVHFTPLGSREVAKSVSKYIEEQRLLRR